MLKFFIGSAFFAFFTITVFAQEVVTPLSSNPIQQRNFRQQPRISNSLDTLVLPFVDDFSSRMVTPEPNKWTDRFVYINTDMADGPPTLGVATFDGLDEQGLPYDILATTSSGVADHLTSQAINLGGDDLSDSVYLSFFWQPAGLCEAPEVNDSLTLSFFGSDSTWTRIWSVTGSSNQPFRQEMILIEDSLFFHGGFRFRFTSNGSLTGNVDVWHLDYVRLNRSRSRFDTSITDVGFKTRPSSILNLYQEMPYRQYLSDTSKYKSTTHAVTARNLGSDRNVAYKYSTVNALTGQPIADVNFQSISPFLSNSDVTFTYNAFSVPRLMEDSLTLETTYLLQNNPDFLAANDTVRRIQRFWNHFAYDDGTAETGYGLNIIGGSIAQKFYISTPDTLRGIWMYFTQAAENAALELFNLKVWSFIGENAFTGSESLLRQQELLRPRYADSIGQFVYYALDTPVLVRDSFYVGWQQLTPKLLNIGLDRNNQVSGTKWFNTQGQWNESLITGSWMMRPVVGDSLVYPTNVMHHEKLKLNIFPNPASNYFNIECDCEPKKWSLKDITGRIVLEAMWGEEVVSLVSTPAGVYFLELQDVYGLVGRKKLIVNR